MKLTYGYTQQVHELAEKYIARDILCLDSTLINDLLNQSFIADSQQVTSQFSIDNIINLAENEIYEWYRITEWLAERLINLREPVLSNDYGYWWGRACTGQAIILDGTIQEIAKIYV